MFALHPSRLRLVLFAISLSIAHAHFTPAYTQTRKIESWLDFKFDASATMGDAKNPAVLIPSSMAVVLGDMPMKQSGDTVFIPASQLQEMASNPLMAIAIAPLLKQLSNVKSFDGFSAVDMTSMIKNLPSEIIEAPDSVARK